MTAGIIVVMVICVLLVAIPLIMARDASSDARVVASRVRSLDQQFYDVLRRANELLGEESWTMRAEASCWNCGQVVSRFATSRPVNWHCADCDVTWRDLPASPASRTAAMAEQRAIGMLGRDTTKPHP